MMYHRLACVTRACVFHRLKMPSSEWLKSLSTGYVWRNFFRLTNSMNTNVPNVSGSIHFYRHPTKWSFAARPEISNATVHVGARASALSTACMLLDGKVVVKRLATRFRLVGAMMDGLPGMTTQCIEQN